MKSLNSDNYKKLKQLDKYLYGHNGFIAGGCFKNLLNNETIKDIDIFFENKEEFERGIEAYKEQEFWEQIYSNDNAVGFYNSQTKMRVDLVCSIFGNPEQIIGNFDFTIVKFAYQFIRETDDNENITYSYKIICDDDFFEHLHMRRLIINDKIPFPISTFERSLRYTKYGYHLCRESKVKLLTAIIKLHDENPEIYISELLTRGLYAGVD